MRVLISRKFWKTWRLIFLFFIFFWGLALPEVLVDVETELYPHKLCDYIFDLSQRFNVFYENCPVANADTAEQQQSRAALCAVTANTLKLVLDILGINTVERL